MRLLQDLLEITSTASAKSQLNERLNARLLSSSVKLKSRPEDNAELDGCCSIDELADLITTLKVLAKKEFRSALTKDDIGINPNSAKELLGMLNKVPDNIKTALPKEVTDFLKHVSMLAPSLRGEEKTKLADLTSHDLTKRRTAEKYLAAMALSADKMITKLTTLAR